jgi:predicted nuclease with TOPRIM domain
MEVTEYCENLTNELTGWKAKMYDVVSKLDKMDTGDKTKVVPHVNELHMIIEEFDDRINRLRTNCQVEFSEERAGIEERTTHFQKKWDEMWKEMSPAEFGG